MSTSIVEVKNLCKSYKGSQKAAVADISFGLRPGEILALLGPNGAGKTTTIKMLLGLVTPSSGTALVNGFDMAVERERQLGARHLGAVLEGARNVYWRLSAQANLRYFGTLHGVTGPTLKRRIDELLSLLDLQAVAHQEVRFFSRGMQQKVAIAATLLHDPDVLLLDEPTLGLDVQAAKALERVIVELAGQGKAILLTTHMMNLAERLSNRILVIRDGREVAHDDTPTLLQRYNIRSTVEVKVQGDLPAVLRQQLQACFPAVTPAQSNGTTLLAWPEPEQQQVAQLFTFLDREGCTVLSVQRREASLEDVFLSLVGETMP